MKVIFLHLAFVVLSPNLSFALDHSYQSWNRVLSQFVVVKGPASEVKYLQLKGNSHDLDSFLKEASAVSKAEYQTFTQNQKLAFLFNSYNAFTLKHILNHHSAKDPLESIKDIGSLFKSSWKIKFFQFLGEESHLDRLEQDLARPNFDDPRMHMAFNCASKGCPALQNQAFVADKLDQQLDKATQDFLSDKERNVYEEKSGSLQVSAIFKWYKADFEKSKKLGPLSHFLAKYMNLSPAVKNNLEAGKISIKYLDYNWKLNAAQE